MTNINGPLSPENRFILHRILTIEKKIKSVLYEPFGDWIVV